MAKLHFLNVKQGDCIIIEHASQRVTMMDICAGNTDRETPLTKALRRAAVSGNFKMCESPTNPLGFLSDRGLNSIFRFILSHPDMDHLDGFDALASSISIANFWDSGARKAKPDFKEGQYREEDWNRYVRVRDGKDSATSLLVQDGQRFKYANQNDNGKSGGDGLYILHPNSERVKQANATQEFNDASYVILYRSIGGRVLLPGDAHDGAWEHVLLAHGESVKNVPILIAPHHGRRSGANFEYLDWVQPKLTLFGCAPSEHLAYDEWRKRGLPIITNNQAGCVTCDLLEGRIDVYVENKSFATATNDGKTPPQDPHGFYFVGSLSGE